MMSDSDEPRRDFREAAALLADTLLFIDAAIDWPEPDVFRTVRAQLRKVEKDMERCGFTLKELSRNLQLYLGTS